MAARSLGLLARFDTAWNDSCSVVSAAPHERLDLGEKKIVILEAFSRKPSLVFDARSSSHTSRSAGGPMKTSSREGRPPARP